MEVDGMQVSTRWADPPQHHAASGRPNSGAAARLTRLSLRGPDMSGIAYTVAEYLAKLDINIEQLDTSTVEIEPGTSEGEVGDAAGDGGAGAGRAVFVMEALIGLPPDVAVDQVTLACNRRVTMLRPTPLQRQQIPFLRRFECLSAPVPLSSRRCWRTSNKFKVLSACR